ncbi:MAG TPA: hypothetical protein EYQ24_16665 [Bacteroidetes bacterium]|nr:hypothetical protein [Bacteroidota bacterium]
MSGAVPRPRAERLADALSYLLNPLAFPPVAFALVSWHFGAAAGEVAWVFGVSLVFFAIVPLLALLWMVREGRATSLEVRDKSRRTLPMLVCVGSYALGIALLGATATTAVRVLVAFAAIYPVNTLILLGITRWWKISIHMAGLAAFVSGLLFVSLVAWEGLPDDWEAALTVATTAPLVLLLPVLMWARVRAKAHTVGQVVAGAAFGLFVPLAELYWLTFHALDLA